MLVVRDANGNIIGTIVGNDVIDAQGRKVGTVKDGKVYDLNGNLIPGAEIVLRKDAQQVVRDASGKVLGTDTFGLSAPSGEIFKEFGLTKENLVAVARAV